MNYFILFQLKKTKKKFYEILLALKDVFVYYSKYDSPKNQVCLEIKKYLTKCWNRDYKNPTIKIIIGEIINS